MTMPNGRVLMRVKHRNGEYENVVRRFKIPGKNRGFLGVTESGNCYTLFRDMAWWVMDLAEHPDVDREDRDAVLAVYKKESDQRGTEALATYIKHKMGE